MNLFRGILMFGVGAFALYHGWAMHNSQRALWAYALGIVAIVLGIWRITRNPDKPLV